MAKIRFWKYEGTGNDFIMIDNRSLSIKLTQKEIEKLCHRHFGIGADGLILIQPENGYDFRMVYFNSDGKESTFCGNGGRCVVAFARHLGIIENEAFFIAKDGPHTAQSLENSVIRLKMRDVENIENVQEGWVLFTGSPHLVVKVAQTENFPVKEEGARIRYGERFEKEGININFVEKRENGIEVRTYERGVEDETFSCGTGVTAAAIVASSWGYHSPIRIFTPGGNLMVEFEKVENFKFRDVFLSGPAHLVFEGSFEI
jgi:diaminopimelate epimerase